MSRSILVLLLLVSSFVMGQTPGQSETGDTGKVYHKVMIVPFEEQMYLCGFQRDIAQASGKTHQEIVRFFRYGIASELQNKFLYYYNTVSLIHFNDTTKDVLRTYASVQYQFEPYEKEEVEEEGTGNKTKKKKKEPKEETSKIQGGQVVSNKTTTPKFASLYFARPEILSYLNNKYGADLFVFITEMDIENDISDQVALANNRYKRILRIHYAIVNSDGEFIAKGVAETTFYNNVNQVEVIKSQHFPAIAEQIASKLPGMKKEEPIEINPLEKILPGKKPN